MAAALPRKKAPYRVGKRPAGRQSPFPGTPPQVRKRAPAKGGK
jgi:hypothetical protein